MKIEYPAVIKWNNEDEVYEVDFPDLDGCLTYGETLDDAKAMAKEALSVYLESLDSRKIAIKEPSSLKGENVFYIEPDKNVGFAIWLKMERKRQGLTQVEFAKRLGISYQSYQKIETPTKSNPTLKTIFKLEEVLHTNIIRI